MIFREFHRLDEGAKVARGLGLGLSIVERIARVLDHKVDLRSAPRRGSRFSVEVPLSSAAPPSQAPREPQRVDRGQLAGIAVLCIDNEPKMLDGMETLLGGWGCQRAEGAGSRDRHRGRRPTRKAAPNGLLVDYHLDHGNGIDAIAELRRRFGADLPAILITADRSPARARGGARARRPGAEQAGQARGAARADGAMARAAGGGGGVGRQSGFNARAARPAATGRASILAAAITAWVRLSTPSFCRIAETCAFTVASDTVSS